MLLVEDQLLSNYIGVTDSLRHTITPSHTLRLAFSATSPLFEDRFGRSFRFAT